MPRRRDPLSAYRDKRRFDRTTEPAGDERSGRSDAPPRFVVQKHAARRLHYDFRLEIDGVLVSWAVPKGPSLDPTVKRLAVQTEDHPLAYGDFEGVIPQGEYGGGTVLVWDHGVYANLKADAPGDRRSMGQALAAGRIEVVLRGEKLRGGFTLVRSSRGERDWLLIKKRDDYADPERDLLAERPESVLSGRDLEQIASAEG